METMRETQGEALATLLLLSRRVRKAKTVAELKFLLLNETHSLIHYQQAALWDERNQVTDLSGVSSIEKNSPYVTWLNHWFRETPSDTGSEAFITDLDLLKRDEADWKNWLTPHVANVSMPEEASVPRTQLLLSRDKAFTREELSLLQEWFDIWSDRYRDLYKPGWLMNLVWKKNKATTKRIIPISVLVVAIIVGLLPVNISVLAPAELIPLNPTVVRSPIDGIVDRILVKPNQRVHQGEGLFEFDKVSLENQLALAHQALLTAQAEYRQKAQRAVFDAESKARLVVLQSLIDEKQIEFSYLRELINRSSVKASRDGIVLLSDETEWVGRPVITGERIMVIADEFQSQIQAWISPADFINFPNRADLTLFLTSDPSLQIKAKVRYISHEPELRPDGSFAHRLRAELERSDHQVQIGQGGTARIEGDRVSVLYWIFRRPMAAFRGWLGA